MGAPLEGAARRVPERPRVWLLLAACAFALTAVAGGLLLALDPTPASVGSIALALAFSLVCLHLATRAPRGHVPSCGACGAMRDLGLSFCAKCGS